MTQIIYEDEVVEVIIPDACAVKGHLRIVPKSDVKTLDQLDAESFEHIFYVASYAATALFELLGAQGTNIISSSNYIDVVARFSDDGLNLMWTPKPATPADLDDVAKKIKDKTDYIGVVVPKSEPIDMEKSESISDNEKEINYLLKSLRKIP